MITIVKRSETNIFDPNSFRRVKIRHYFRSRLNNLVLPGLHKIIKISSTLTQNRTALLVNVEKKSIQHKKRSKRGKKKRSNRGDISTHNCICLYLSNSAGYYPLKTISIGLNFNDFFLKIIKN